MSGGSLDYVYFKVEEAAESVRARAEGNPLYLAFSDHLKLVATALHDIEWVLSSDTSPGDDTRAIERVLGDKESSIKKKFFLSEAERVIGELQALINSEKPSPLPRQKRD